MKMRTRTLAAAVVVAGILMAAGPVAAEPVGSAFTYQGSLNKAGAPVSAPQDFEFGLYGSAAGDDQVGTTVSLPGVAVTKGLFNVDLDFGPRAFGSEKRYLQINVRPSGDGSYTALWPRVAVMPAPAAMSETPKLLLSLPSNQVVWLGFNIFEYFTPSLTTDDLEILSNGVRVKTGGTYLVSTYLTLDRNLSIIPHIDGFITLNNAPVATLQFSGSIDNPVYSAYNILQLKDGDVVSMQITASNYGTLIGGASQSTTFKVVRLD